MVRVAVSWVPREAPPVGVVRARLTVTLPLGLGLSSSVMGKLAVSTPSGNVSVPEVAV